MSAKHTPGSWCTGSGEWGVEQPYATDTGSTHWKHITDANGNVLALVVDATQSFYVSDMLEANARLIAAAPDLLAAALDFVAKVERGEAKSTRSYAAFKAAIAKATG